MNLIVRAIVYLSILRRPSVDQQKPLDITMAGILGVTSHA